MALANHSDQRYRSILLPKVDGLMRGVFYIARKEFKLGQYLLNLLCIAIKSDCQWIS
jgi:hypothetical protein